MRQVLVGLWIVGILLCSVPADAGSRTALIVGNDAYAHLPKLRNAVNDARALDARLRELGFETILKLDASGLDLNRAIFDFAGRVTPGGVGLVFYAGHGIESEGRNYLIPVDAELESEVDLAYAAVDVTDVLERLKDARAAVNVVILDACRDNPLPKKGRSGARGLAVVPAPSGTFVAYAAGPGKVAQDGEAGGNGIFTGELLKALAVPGLQIDEVFQRTRAGVYRQTGGRQEPWSLTSLTGNFYFVEPTATPTVATTSPPASSGFDPRSTENLFWASIKDSSRASDYEAYLSRYPGGIFAPLAKGRLAELQGGQVASLPASPAPLSPPASASGLSVVDLDESYVTLTASNLRSEPSTDGGRLGTLSAGTRVRATGKLSDGSWFRVTHAGGVAWVWGELVGPAGSGPTATPVVGVYPPARKAGDVFQDCAACPEMVVLPPGEFLMGSPPGELERDDVEDPQHRVRIGSSIAVGKYEVTFEEWDACVADGGCGGYRPDDKRWGRGRRPVMKVSWKDAQAYVRWLSGKTGQSYRLLSESEWEYAARAGTTTAFNTGDRITAQQANFDGEYTYNGSAKGKDRGQTVEVGSFGSNRFGLHDMHGNVLEWVEDCWNGSYAGAPSDGSAWLSGECGRRVLRGGAWNYEPGALRSAFRNRSVTWNRITGDVGFRVARTL